MLEKHIHHHHSSDDCGELEITIKLRGTNLAQSIITITFNIAPATAAPVSAGKPVIEGRVNEPLEDDIQLQGGTPPYSVIVNDPGSLPPGVNLDSDGKVSGTPTQDGTFSVNITVNDQS
jgi:hypothetical protein